jgi:hypothetical protein
MNQSYRERNERKPRVRPWMWLPIIVVLGALVWILWLFFISGNPPTGNLNKDVNAANKNVAQTNANQPLTNNNNEQAVEKGKELEDKVSLLKRTAVLASIACKSASSPTTVNDCKDIDKNIVKLAKNACDYSTEVKSQPICNGIKEITDESISLESIKKELSKPRTSETNFVKSPAETAFKLEDPIDSSWKRAVLWFLTYILIITALAIVGISFFLHRKIDNFKESFDNEVVELKTFEKKTEELLEKITPLAAQVNKDDISAALKPEIKPLADAIEILNNTFINKANEIDRRLKTAGGQGAQQGGQVKSLQNQIPSGGGMPLPKAPVLLKELMQKRDQIWNWKRVKRGKFTNSPLVETSDDTRMYVIASGNEGFIVPVLEDGVITGEYFDQFFKNYYEKRNLPSGEKRIAKFARVDRVEGGWRFDGEPGVFEFEFEDKQSGF